MPLVTTLHCPHCGKKITTTSMVPKGAKVRCPHCKEVHQILPVGDALFESIMIQDARVPFDDEPSSPMPPRQPI